MSHSITASLTRSVAFAALMSAPLVAAPLTLAQAQNTAPMHSTTTTPGTTPSAASPTNAAGQGVEQRITQLHAELKITPDQESKWNSVAQAMRDNAANMEKLVAEKRQQGPQNMSAVDDLKTYQEFTQAHLDGLKNLTSAFSSLYDSMSDQQKKNADEVFAKFNRAEPHGAANRNG
jgi:periplasmic protein CpxP/Spy